MHCRLPTLFFIKKVAKNFWVRVKIKTRLVFLFKYSGEISFFCLHVKRILKPRPSGEVAAIADGEGNCSDFRPRLYEISSFSSAEKEAKRHRDTCGCVPDPATLLSMWEHKRLFSKCRDRRPRLSEKNGGGSKPPALRKRSFVYVKIQLSDLQYGGWIGIKPQSDSRGRLSLQLIPLRHDKSCHLSWRERL